MIQHAMNSVRSTLIRWLQTPKEREDYEKIVERCRFLENELAQMQVQKEESEAAYQQLQAQKAESEAAYQQLHQRCKVLEEKAASLLKEAETLGAFCDVRAEVTDHIERVLSRPEEVEWIKDLIHSQAEEWVRYLDFQFEVH